MINRPGTGRATQGEGNHVLGSTISTYIDNGVTLGVSAGSGNYLSPLTITSTGEVYTYNQIGVELPGSLIPGNQNSTLYLLNEGTISTVGAIGIEIGDGNVVNRGEINASEFGVNITASDAVTVPLINYGTISNIEQNGGGAVINYGVVLNSVQSDSMLGGSLINHGTLAGRLYSDGSSSVTNYGFINGYYAEGSAALVNKGTIAGVEAQGAGTVTNAGIINDEPGTTYAVQFASGISRLIVDPGAVFNGSVIASGQSKRQTIELATGSPTGTLSGLGSQFADFGNIDFDSGANWLVRGNVTGLASGQTISGFEAGDTIVLQGISTSSDSFVTGTGLVLNENGTSLALDFIGSFQTANFGVTDISGATPSTSIVYDTAVHCFAEGTRILTPDGEMPIEALQVGDRVITVRDDGAPTARIIWIGQRTLDPMRHPDPAAVWPVRIMAGAFGKGIPEQDVRLSPHHAIYIDGELYEAVALVNGVTIIQETQTRRISYHHIELEQHDIILAEGLPVETYLDTGDRLTFETLENPIILHPDWRAPISAEPCVPLHRDGPKVAAAKAMLLRLANAFKNESQVQFLKMAI
jgi:hypothetical protein